MTKNPHVEDFLELSTKCRPERQYTRADANTKGEMLALHILYRGENKLTPGDLQKKMNVVSGRVGNMLRSLEEKGMITRVLDKKDHRKILISLTQKGVQKVENAYDKLSEAIELFVSSIGEEAYYVFLNNAVALSKAFNCSQKNEI